MMIPASGINAIGVVEGFAPCVGVQHLGEGRLPVVPCHAKHYKGPLYQREGVFRLRIENADWVMQPHRLRYNSLPVMR